MYGVSESMHQSSDDERHGSGEKRNKKSMSAFSSAVRRTILHAVYLLHAPAI